MNKLFLPNDFNNIAQILKKLFKKENDLIFNIKDFGLLYYLLKFHPELKLTYCSKTTNLNIESIKYLSKLTYEQVLSESLKKTDLKLITDTIKTHFKNPNSEDKFLHYSPRNIAKELKNHGIDTKKIKYIVDIDHPEYKLFIVQKKHGFFIFPELQTQGTRQKALGSSGAQYSTLTPRPNPNKTLSQLWKRIYVIGAGFTPALGVRVNQRGESPFSKNNSRGNLDKRTLSNYQKHKITGKYLGIVLDSLPSKWLTVELKKIIKPGQKITFLTTENKTYELLITEIKSIDNKTIKKAPKNCLVRIKSNRQVLPKTLLI